MDDRRLVTCRVCKNRVSRAARRCPSCGPPAPAAPQPDDARPSRPARPAGGRRLLLGAAGVLAVLLTFAALTFVVASWRVPEPARAPAPRAAGEAPPAFEAPALPPPPPGVVVSRSRGRADWSFFFRPGDRLAAMADEQPLGEVVRVERTHVFPDGTSGPAYIVRSPEGGEQSFDADVLERTARAQ